VSQDERQELIDWIDTGNSVYDNPWNMADESGRPMDYLTAIRVNDDLRERMAQQQSSGES